MTNKEFLNKLANKNESDSFDSEYMQVLLRKLGFPQAQVVTGIVYLDGRGTIEAPPSDVHSIAKKLLEVFEKKKTK